MFSDIFQIVAIQIPIFANIHSNFGTSFHIVLKLLKHFLIILITWFPSIISEAGPRQWFCMDLSGKQKFSVFADTIFAIQSDLFVIYYENQAVIFKDDPFHPVWFGSGTEVKKGNKDFCFFGKDGLQSIVSLPSLAKNRKFQFEKICFWNGQILGKTNEKWVFKPGSVEELFCDSFKTVSSNLFLFTNRGLVKVDSNFNPRFFPIVGSPRILSPKAQYYKSENTWFPFLGGAPIPERNKGFWWGNEIFVDTLGQFVFLESQRISIKFKADSVSIISDKFLLARKDKSFFVITDSARRIKISKPLEVKSLGDTLCGVRTKKQWILIGISGQKSLVNPTVGSIFAFEEGFIMAKAGKRYGFIDHSGFIRIACRYDSLLNFKEGLSAAKLGREWGFLDRNERLIIQPNFNKVSSFENGCAIASKNGKNGILSQKGQFLLPMEYEKIEPLRTIGWLIRKNNWVGFASKGGEITIAPRFFNIIEASKNTLKVFRDEKSGLFSSTGKPILELKYKIIECDPETQNIFSIL